MKNPIFSQVYLSSSLGFGEVLGGQGLHDPGPLGAGRGARARARELVERNLAYSRASLEILSKWVEDNPHLSWVEPRARFTRFPRYDYGVGSVDLCEKLLDEEGVLLSPGAFFGVEGYLRICTGVPADVLEKGLRRVNVFMGRQG